MAWRPFSFTGRRCHQKARPVVFSGQCFRAVLLLSAAVSCLRVQRTRRWPSVNMDLGAGLCYRCGGWPAVGRGAREDTTPSDKP